MNYKLAADEMLTMASGRVKPPYIRQNDEYPTDFPHLFWMLGQLRDDSMSEGKSGRWLGWAQGCLVMKGVFTLQEMKDLNRACSCDDEGCPHFGTTHTHS